MSDNQTDLPENYFSRIFTLIISVAIVMTGFGIIFPVFPQLLVSVGGGNAADLGFMAASFGVAYLIFSPIFGNIADTFGRKRVILIGLLGFSFSNLIYINSSEVWHFYIARAIEGGFSSAILPPAIALTTQLTPKNVRAKYIGYLVSGNTIGLIIGPLIGGVLYDGITINSIQLVQGSVFLPFWVSFFIGLSAFMFGVIFLPSAHNNIISNQSNLSDKKHEKDGEIELIGKNSLRPTYEKPIQTSITPAVVLTQQSSRRSFSQVLKHQVDVLPRPLMMFWIFLLADIFAVLPWLIVSPGFIFYFYEELFLTASDFGYFVAGYGLFAALGQAFLGNLSDKYGRKRVLIVGQFFSVGFYALLPLGRLSWHFLLIVIFAGVAGGLRDPAMKALLSDVTDDNTRATVFGIESGLLSISQIIGPIVGGFVYVKYGIAMVFLLSTSIAFLNILVISVIRLSKNEESEEKTVDLTHNHGDLTAEIANT